MDHDFNARTYLWAGTPAFYHWRWHGKAYLAQMALSLDYEITACDPRKDLLEQFSIAGVRKVADMPDDLVRAHE